MSTMVEKWIKKGEAKGKAEGKAEGIIEGEAKGEPKWTAKGKADTIVLILNSNFGFIPVELENRINLITDIERLNKLTLLATRCQSLEEFEKEL